jgi:CDP-4-dehydro-6-deoxyglucose reductase/ferredoxin-NAD(P)+ reductase (naphthalene dioxygenase ferredoxin-specific)
MARKAMGKAPVKKQAAAPKAAPKKAAAKKAARKPRARSFQVTITNKKKVIDVARDETILDAAVREGIDYPYACASGNCGTCISQLDSGKVSPLPRSDTSLSPDQEEAGQTLACRARPRSDITITWLGRGRK